MNSKLNHLIAACLLLTTFPSLGGINDDTIPPPPPKKECDESGTAADRSFEWKVEVGLARYAKPDGLTTYGQLGYEPDGGLPDFAALFARGFSQNPLQESQVVLELSQPQIGAATFHPSCLFLHSEATNEIIRKPAAGGFPAFIHQVVTNDRFTLIDLLPAPESGWRLRVWRRDAIAPALLTKSGGYYITSGFEALPPSKPPLKDVIFKRPTGATGNDTLLLQFKEASGVAGVRSVTAERVQTVDSLGRPVTLSTKVFSGEGTAGTLLSQQNLSYSERGTKAWDYTITREVLTSSLDAAGNNGALTLTAKTREDYDDFSTTAIGGELGMKRLVSKTDAFEVPGQSPQTTTFTYVQAPANHATHGRMLSSLKPDGSWTYHEYSIAADSPVSIATEYSGWKDLAISQRASARKTVTTVSANESTTESYVGGQLVSKLKNTVTTGTGDRYATSEKWDGTAWHATTTAYFPETAAAPDTGRIKWIENADGTATTYSYASVGGKLVVTARTGAGTRSGVTAGTEVKTTYGLGNHPVSEITKDIASNLTTEQWDTDLTYNGGFDQMGRPIKRIYNADVNDYDIAQYACCGLEFSRSRMGATTQYFRDGLKRVYKTESKASAASPAVTEFTTLDGLTTTHSRSIGGQTHFLGSSARSLDGLTRATTAPSAKSTAVADRPVTTSVTAHSATGDIVTTAYADGSDSITANYLDGRVKSTSGSAVPDVTYDYATHSENGGGETSSTNASGLITTTFTDLLGRTRKSVSGATGTTTYAYHPLTAAPGTRTQLQSVTDGDNVTVTYGYNPEGQRTTTSRSIPLAGGGTATQVTTQNQDVVPDVTLHGVSLGTSIRRTQTIASTGIAPVTTSQSYASTSGLVSGSSSLGRQTLSVSTRPDASGVATRTTTNPDGTRIVQTTTHGLLTGNQTKDTTGSLITGTSYAYDTLQHPLTVTDSRTGATTFSNFTEAGRPLTTTTPAGQVTSVENDIMGRPIKTTLPDASVTHTAYHPTGQVKATWGSQTYPTWNVYDEQGRMTQLHTWKSAPTLDPSAIPANPPGGSEVTIWIYGPTTGHLVEKNYSGETDDGTTDADYTHTPGGRLLTRTWERGITTTYGYTHGLMTSTDYSDTTPDVTITYDALGRQSTVTQASQSKIVTTYDPATLTIDTETISYDLDHDGTYEFTRLLDRSRDTLNRDTGFQLKNGPTLENQAIYGYSATDGRLSTVADDTSAFRYDYLPGSHLIEKITATAGAVHTVTNTLEPTRDVLATKQNKAGTTVISQYDYTVNPLGQRTDLTTAFDLGGTHTANPGDTVWGYDSLGQVISAAAPGTAADRYFAYDAIGNRLESRSETSTNLGGTLTQYFGKLTPTPESGANRLNQYVGIAKGGVTLQPLFDLDGNMTHGPLPAAPTENSSLVWDAENRLTEVQIGTAGPHVRHYYDAASRKIATTANSLTILYLYDGFNCIAEYTGDSLAKTRLWGMDLSGSMQGAGGVGGLLCESQISNSQISNHFPTYDGNGNVSEYLNSTGQVIAHFEYDPFGNLTVDSENNAASFPYRFSTKPQDAATGLYYYTYRYYDPLTGRWPSRDPIEEEGGINLYGFIWNDGTNGVDYLGLDAAVKCNRCKKKPAGKMTCINIEKGKQKGKPYPSNEGTNNPNLEPGKYDLLPKPDSQMDEENRNLPDNQKRDDGGKVNGPGGAPEYPRGTPSITHPSKHNNPGQARPDKPKLNNHRVHGPGTSNGCMASEQCGTIKEMMDRNTNKGGTTYEIIEVDCEDCDNPPAPKP